MDKLPTKTTAIVNPEILEVIRYCRCGAKVVSFDNIAQFIHKKFGVKYGREKLRKHYAEMIKDEI